MLDKDGAVIDRREMLRVKAKSLAEEARIIRREEKRSRGTLREQLHLHRVQEVRREARDTYIAYGLIKGRTYDQIESPRKGNPARWSRVHSMYQRYGPVGHSETLGEFLDRVLGENRRAEVLRGVAA